MSSSKKIKRSAGDRAFDWINYLFLALFSLTILFPFWNLFVQSVSSPDSGVVDALQMWPKKFSAFNYKYVLANKYIWTGYRETLIRTIAGTALSVTLTAMGAYVLSKKKLPNRNFWTTVVLIPMFFSGGMIPSYLWMVNLHLIDNRLVLILPGLISSYNLIIMRNFFMSVPEGLEESAMIDGAGSIRIFFSIVLPISKAVLATVALWVMVGHWNAWFDATIYITDPEKTVMQVVLRRISIENSAADMNAIMVRMQKGANAATSKSVEMAMVVITILPMLVVYPFLQKYFVKGIMVGSIKG